MPNAAAMQISFPAAGAWIASTAGVVWAAGALPTWLLAGEAGMAAQAVAGGIVLVVMIASAAIVVALSRGGISKAAMGFMVMGVVRMAACLGAAGLAIFFLPLLKTALLIWTAAFYMATLGSESIWLFRAIRRAGVEQRERESLHC